MLRALKTSEAPQCLNSSSNDVLDELFRSDVAPVPFTEEPTSKNQQSFAMPAMSLKDEALMLVKKDTTSETATSARKPQETPRKNAQVLDALSKGDIASLDLDSDKKTFADEWSTVAVTTGKVRARVDIDCLRSLLKRYFGNSICANRPAGSGDTNRSLATRNSPDDAPDRAKDPARATASACNRKSRAKNADSNEEWDDRNGPDAAPAPSAKEIPDKNRIPSMTLPVPLEDTALTSLNCKEESTSPATTLASDAPVCTKEFILETVLVDACKHQVKYDDSNENLDSAPTSAPSTEAPTETRGSSTVSSVTLKGTALLSPDGGEENTSPATTFVRDPLDRAKDPASTKVLVKDYERQTKVVKGDEESDDCDGSDSASAGSVEQTLIENHTPSAALCSTLMDINLPLARAHSEEESHSPATARRDSPKSSLESLKAPSETPPTSRAAASHGEGVDDPAGSGARGRTLPVAGSANNADLVNDGVECPRFLQKGETSGAATKEEEVVAVSADKGLANVNIVTDREGNEYLKIKHLNIGAYIYEAIEPKYDLGPVSKCISEEEESDTEEKRDQPQETGELGLHELNSPWSKFVEESANARLDTPKALLESSPILMVPHITPEIPKQGSFSSLELRSVKASKKRHLHFRKKAIAKATREMKCEVAIAIEKGSSCGRGEDYCKTGSDTFFQEMSDAACSAETGSLVKQEDSGAKHKEQDVPGNVTVEPLDAVAKGESDASRCDKEELLPVYNFGQNKDAPINGLVPLAVDEDSERGFPTSDAQETHYTENEDDSDISAKNESQTASTETALLIRKLYTENVDLAETLASTQSQLKKVNQKLTLVTTDQESNDFGTGIWI